MTNAIFRAVLNLLIGGMLIYAGAKFYYVDKLFLNRAISYYFWVAGIARFNVVILLICFWVFKIEEPYGFPRTFAFSAGEYIVAPFLIVMLLEMSGVLLRMSRWVQK